MESDNTTLKQLAYELVKGIVAEKRARGIIPEYAIETEINTQIQKALCELVANGALNLHTAGVNKKDAYTLKQTIN